MVHVDYLMIATILEGDLHLSRSIIRFGPPEGCVSLYAGASACVRLRAGVTACLRGWGGGVTLFLFINLSESPIPWGRSVFLSVYLFGNKSAFLFA